MLIRHDYDSIQTEIRHADALQTGYNSVVGFVLELHIQTLQEPAFLHRIGTRNGYFPLLCQLGICKILHL